MKYRWLLALMLTGVALTVSCATLGIDTLEPVRIDYDSLENPDAVYGKIRILSAYKLNDVSVNGHAMVELSGLAWSEDEQLLYAVSDHGVVFHLKPELNDGRMTDVSVITAHPLKDINGKLYRYPWRDSEGLDVFNSNNHIAGDDELLVAFEIKPRLERFDNRGNLLGSVKLPKGIDHR
ncbi:MAG: hypothetical protein EP297_00790, partial [Gammaproteobacteria bacterium]